MRTVPVTPDLTWVSDAGDAELDRVFSHLSAGDRVDRIRYGLRKAIDEVIATSRTRRWNLDQCNDQEKAYVGVNLENILRAELDLAPHKPDRPDFEIDGVEVDCKYSRAWNRWQIPREAVGEICLLVYGDDLEDEIAIGLIRIREEILVGGNRDKKRTLQSPGGVGEVRWLLQRGSGLPPNFLMSLRRQDREAILAPRGGDARARELFIRCEGMVIERHTIEAIGQQVDESRRFRGETIAALKTEGFEVLNGTRIAKRNRAAELGGPSNLRGDQWICLRTDGSTPARREALDQTRMAEAAAYRLIMKQELKDLAEKRKRSKLLRSETVALLEALEDEQELLDAQTQKAVREAEGSAAASAEQLTLGTTVPDGVSLTDAF
jgi:hypothetical protein